FYFFFFQAEDGIRDRNVTGVQTCALPIYVEYKSVALARALNYAKATDFMYDSSGQVKGVIVTDRITGETYKMYAKKVINATGPRSEERRVGKEWRER